MKSNIISFVVNYDVEEEVYYCEFDSKSRKRTKIEVVTLLPVVPVRKRSCRKGRDYYSGLGQFSLSFSKLRKIKKKKKN